MQRVLAKYPPPIRTARIQAIDSTGFSGASIWKLLSEQGEFCLRRWPSEHPSPARLTWIHQHLQSLGAAGLRFIPLPWRASDGASWVEVEGTLWEVSDWMPGAADFHQHPSPQRLREAMLALSAVHAAWRESPGPIVGPGPSPGLNSRLHQLLALDEGMASIQTALEAIADPCQERLRPLALDWLDLAPRATLRLLPALRLAAQVAVPLQPCLRDVWHDHFLFQGQRLVGLIDFGAMNVENPVADLARSLRSLLRSPPNQCSAALDHYQQTRSLSPVELSLLPMFDQSAVILSPSQWLRWTLVERRRFKNMTAIIARLEQGLQDLRRQLEVSTREEGWA